MDDTIIAIIGIFVAIILMFVFPIMEMASKNDELSQTIVQVVTSDFANNAARQGKITKFDYDDLVQKLNATGNIYDIQIEVQILDDNPTRTSTGSTSDLKDGKYYSVFTSSIMEKLNGSEGEYILKKDDYIIVTVKNTNVTMATELKNMFYNLIGKETYTIGASIATQVLNGG